MSDSLSQHDDDLNLGFDEAEVSTVPVVITTVLIVITLIAIMAAVTAYYNYYRDAQIEKYQLEPVSQELVGLHEREDKELGSYGVADKAKGILRVPVDRAMELVEADSAADKLKYPAAPYSVIREDKDTSIGAAAMLPPAPAEAAAPPAEELKK